MSEDHEDEVKHPNDVPTEDKSDETCNDCAIFETGDETQNPRCDRNDCKDQTNDPTKTKIIFVVCHNIYPTICLLLAIEETPN